MSDYEITFSSVINVHSVSGIIDTIPTIPPSGVNWHIVNSSFIKETSQFCWVWKKNDIESVIPDKPDPNSHNRIYAFSTNICDPTTWYIDSQYANNILLASATGQKEFIMPPGDNDCCAIIDMSHGKRTEENLLVAPTGSYIVSASVSGITKIERECYEHTGGDFEIIYESGIIRFFKPQYGDVRASFYYTPSGIGPVFAAGPPAGKKWKIESAELQVSSDFSMTDTIVQNVFLTHPIYGRIKGSTDVEYKRFDNFLDFTYGSHPIVQKCGGLERGTKNDTIIMRWEYLTPLVLMSSLQMELRSWAKHGRKFDGERFVVAIYGLEEDE